MQLQLKTWQFVDDYLKTKTGIIIPIGSTEQHGPTGLIGTDALTAEMIGRGAGEKAGALVAPTISVGMAQHHLAFAGSVTLRPTTLIAVVRDTVLSLGGSAAPEAVFEAFRGRAPSVEPLLKHNGLLVGA